MIVAQQLAKRFAAVDALTDVTFAAADGRITGLLGHNGAGKSTTLRILATVLRPDRGNAFVDGLAVADAPLDVRRRIGVLPHAAGLYNNLTGRENLTYYARLLQLGQPQRAVTRIIERLDLGAFVDRRSKGYSRGERTRVALGRALIHEPPNLLLDEPTAGLDVMATRALRETIIAYRDAGNCILLSSHVMQEVAALCDDIVIIAAGRVAIRGTPEAIRRQSGHADLEEAFVAISGADG